MDREKIIDKIRKLMKHRDSAGKIGSQAEAEAFAEKIQQLMIEHELELSEIKMTERDAKYDDPIDREIFQSSEPGMKRRLDWHWTLAKAVAKAHFCDILVPTQTAVNYIVFVGKGANRSVAIYMYQVLSRAALNLAEIEYLRHWKQEQHRPGGDVRRLRGFKQSFLDAFAETIERRYYEQRLRTNATSSTALILRDVEGALDRYMAQFRGGRGAKRPGHGNADNMFGRKSGQEHGEKASLSAGGIEAPRKTRGEIG